MEYSKMDVQEESVKNTSSESEDVDSFGEIVTVDDILHYLGDFGVYQQMVSLMLVPFGFFNVFVYFGQMFMTLVPEEHWCKLPEVDGMNREEMRDRGIPRIQEVPYEGHELPFSRCWMYDVPISTLLSVQTSDPKWPKKRCQSWEFKFTTNDVPYATVASDLGWVCDDKYLVNLSQSIFFVGSIFGGVLFGWMADKYGRIPVLVATNMFGFFAGIATIFTRAFWYFGLCRFLVGFASDNNFTMMYILVLEYVGPKFRTLVANISIAVCFPLACCSLPWLAFYLSNWKTFAIATSAPLAFAIVTPLMVPESVRWLVCQGRIDEAIKIMRRIERVNKADVPEWTYSDFKDDAKKLKDMIITEEEYGVSDLFKTPRLRRFTILLMAIWGIIAMVFDGHIRNLGALGLNIFVTFTISSLTTFPADILVALFLDYYGRRWSSFASLFLSGLACFLASLTSGVYFASLGLIGRFLINISYSIGLQYAAELLPTEIRAKGVSLIHIFGYATAIISPFIAYMRVLDRRTPIIILGILSTIGGILCLFLPETLNRELSQSLQDGEDFGRDQKFFDMPCIGAKEFEDKPNKHYLHAHRTTTRGEVLRSSIISGVVGSRYRLQSIWSQQIADDADDRISRTSGTSDRKIFNRSETSSPPSSNGMNDARD